jgi:hypothetical protein
LSEQEEGVSVVRRFGGWVRGYVIERRGDGSWDRGGVPRDWDVGSVPSNVTPHNTIPVEIFQPPAIFPPST